MIFKLDEKRKNTMRVRLGEACQFIDDERYLPMFRNRQKRFPEEFAKSIELAKKIKNGASKYFAHIWSSKNINKSLEILRSIINRAKSLLAKIRFEKKQLARISKSKKGANISLRERYLELKNAKLAHSSLL